MAKKKENKVKKLESKEEYTDIILMLKKIDKSYWITAAIIIVIVAAFIAGFFYMKNANTFVYEGINFNKTMQGQIIYYVANVPLIDKSGNIVSYITIDFRNDPRKIGGIKVEFENLAFIKNKQVFVSYESSNKSLEDGNLAAASFGRFLGTLGLNPKGAMSDSSYSNNTNLLYVTCENTPNNTVIMIKLGEETRIKQVSLNCYEIIFKDDEILKATERFQLMILEEYMKNFRV